MGYIDSNEFTVSCPKCGAKEDARVVQRGSSFGADWSSPPSLEKFDAEWKDHGGAGPMIERAKCRKCGVEAIVS